MDENEILSVVDHCIGFTENEGMLPHEFRAYDADDGEIKIEYKGKTYRVIVERVA
jgi:hypothetical protein